MHSGLPSGGKDQGGMRKGAAGRGGMEKNGMGREVQGGLLYMHGAGLCDYDRLMHFLLLYVGIPAPGKVYPADPDSIYVLGHAGDRKTMPAVRYDTACDRKNHLLLRDAVCPDGICIQPV